MNSDFQSSIRVERYSETQHPQCCRCENALDFTHILVISGFQTNLENYLLCAIFRKFRSTQPTRALGTMKC